MQFFHLKKEKKKKDENFKIKLVLVWTVITTLMLCFMEVKPFTTLVFLDCSLQGLLSSSKAASQCRYI